MKKSETSPGRATLLLLLPVMMLMACKSPLPQEPSVAPLESALQYVRNGVIEHGDGIAPDTVAFLGRIVEWDGERELGYRVEADSSTLVEGAIDHYQVQITFEFDPDADIRLTFTSWIADVDTAMLIWTPGQSGTSQR